MRWQHCQFTIDRGPIFGYFAEYANERRIRMTKRDLALLQAEARVFKALGHPTRLYIVQELSKGECCVCRFAEHIEADFSTVSRHLAVLKQAGLVEDEKRGQQVFYRLRVPCVVEFMSCIEAVLRSSAAASVELLR